MLKHEACFTIQTNFTSELFIKLATCACHVSDNYAIDSSFRQRDTGLKWVYVSVPCAAVLQFQFSSETVSVLEGTNASAVVCLQSLNSDLQEDIVVVLQTQNGTAIGESIMKWSLRVLTLPPSSY